MSTDAQIVDGEQLPILLKVDEVARLLRVSSKAVYDMLRRSQIPGARKLGGSWRIHRDTLLDWIAGGHG